MHVKPMRPFFSNMFRMVSPSSTPTVRAAPHQTRNLFGGGKTLDVVTLFHSPEVAASNRMLALMKQGSAAAAETATQDQASDHSAQNSSRPARDLFDIEVTESAPTEDQLRSILEYVGDAKVGDIVQGATSVSDAVKRLAADQKAFKRPVVVDWNNGKAVVGADEAAVKKLIREG